MRRLLMLVVAGCSSGPVDGIDASTDATADSQADVSSDVAVETSIDAASDAPSQDAAPVDLCKGHSVIAFDLPITGASVVTTNLGAFDDATYLVGKIVVPTTPSVASGHVAVAEYQGPPTARMATVSTLPCDFRDLAPWPPPSDPNGVTHPMAWAPGNTATVIFQIGAPSGQTIGLKPGTTYYFNVRNYRLDPTPGPSCGQSACNAIVDLVAQ